MVPVQLSVAVGSMKAGCWLHCEPVTVACPLTVGGVLSVDHDAVCTNGVLSLPQASTYIHVLVCVDVQLVVEVVEVIGYPLFMVIVPVQLSVAVGSMNAGCWLHCEPVTVACPLTVGGVLSVDHDAVCTKGVLSLPQASTYIHVLVCVDVQLVVEVVEVIGYPLFMVIVPVQLSVAVGSMNAGCWLHCEPVTVACPLTVGGVLSVDHDAVCTKGVLSLPQASTYIHVFVCVDVQLVVEVVEVIGYPLLIVMVPVQLSVAVGSMKAGCWLHCEPVTVACPLTVGGVLSVDHDAVCTKGVLSLPQASTYIHVLVCVDVQLVVEVVEVIGYPLLIVMVPVQLSVAVGSMKAGCWLHCEPVTVACPLTVGGVLSV